MYRVNALRTIFDEKEKVQISHGRFCSERSIIYLDKALEIDPNPIDALVFKS